MPRFDLTLESAIVRTPRVQQLEGMFDVEAADKTRVVLSGEAPFEEKPWKVGLIIGPSGAGKSSVAKHLFGDALVGEYEWKRGAVVDGFGKCGIKEITGALSSVGFSSPPSWLRPYAVLSTGEKFRATMARALLDERKLVVVDEFTSVVDRRVAQVGSHAVQRAVRASEDKQFVAVSCHYDIEEWLQPDWILEPHTGRFVWRELRRRPPIELEIARVHHSAWRLFAPHHYMSAKIAHSSACFVAFVDGDPVAFDSWLPFVGKTLLDRLTRRGHRSVTLPDWQGVGIGRTLIDTIASAWAGLGYGVIDAAAHPSIIGQRARAGSPWALTTGPKFSSVGGTRGVPTAFGAAHATRRRIASYRWIGPKMAREQAEQLCR